MSDAAIHSNGVSINAQSDERRVLLQQWVGLLFPDTLFSVEALAGDASFRRYFRVKMPAKTYILMDAPPAAENCDAFIAIARLFENAAVRLPHIYFMDLTQGFLLLSDFGDQQLLPLLNDHTVDALYRSAIDTLLCLQNTDAVKNAILPSFDDALLWREFLLFEDWYLKKHLNIQLSENEALQLKSNYQLLMDSAQSQPAVFVHRDYHSRNIMLCEDGVLGILDFQDAVWGPVTYDLVSLLRDCYVRWTDAQVQAWVFYFYEKNKSNVYDVDFATFMRWFDWTGLQRHLKCLGIFSRLNYRDHKSGYLKDIPRVLNYAISVCERYPELAMLRQCLAMQHNDAYGDYQ